MPADLRITDGKPVWTSQSIVPSRDKVVSPGSSPALAAVSINSQDVFVYVKVDNTGTVDLGTCPCTVAVPAPWSVPTFFSGYFVNTTANQQYQKHGFTFSVSPYEDKITGPGVTYSFGLPWGGRRTWDWSPDGRFFAYASPAASPGNDWNLTVIALQQITRSNGTTLGKGQKAVGTSGVFNGQWTNQQFGWARSQAVVIAGVAAGATGISVTLACPAAPGSGTWGNLLPTSAGQVDWVFLASPCGSVVAIVPKILNAVAGSRSIEVVSTATAQAISLKKNNVPTSVSIKGSNPSITTTQHAANGVQIVTGSGTATVDDPDCTMVGGGVVAWVDRVKASTLPSANLGVLAVGSAVAGLIKSGQSRWVQVPNSSTSGWANQGETHWCLLAQAFTSDGTTVARSWNGQAQSPPSFPVAKNNCAQRNIIIA